MVTGSGEGHYDRLVHHRQRGGDARAYQRRDSGAGQEFQRFGFRQCGCVRTDKNRYRDTSCDRGHLRQDGDVLGEEHRGHDDKRHCGVGHIS